ncbi:hypothetical protein LWS67_23665, partial [Bacillus atrophaeus]|nr:hypothetical protein [Bacillus atrophaeus]
SGRTDVTLGLEGSPRQGQLTVSDNGNGFSRDQVPGNHFGLSKMEERGLPFGCRGGTPVVGKPLPDLRR